MTIKPNPSRGGDGKSRILAYFDEPREVHLKDSTIAGLPLLYNKIGDSHERSKFTYLESNFICLCVDVAEYIKRTSGNTSLRYGNYKQYHLRLEHELSLHGIYLKRCWIK